RRRRVPLPARRQTAPEHRQCLRAQLWRCLRPLCRRVHQEGRKGFGIPPRRRLCLSPVPLHQVLYPSRLGQDRRPVRLCLWHQDPYRWLQGPHCRPPLGQARRLFDRRLSATSELPRWVGAGYPSWVDQSCFPSCTYTDASISKTIVIFTKDCGPIDLFSFHPL
ncbi:hypothetical protein J010_01361, partial [Cryptococcus neoformans]